MNEGMPRYRSPFEKGRLIITFEVCVPHIMMVTMIWSFTIHKQIRLLALRQYRQLNHRNNMAHRYYNSIAFNLNHLRVGSSLNSWKLFCEMLLNINNYYLNIIVYILAKERKKRKKANLFPLSNQFCFFFVFFYWSKVEN